MDHELISRFAMNAIFISIHYNFDIFIFSALYCDKEHKPFSLTWRYFILYSVLFASFTFFDPFILGFISLKAYKIIEISALAALCILASIRFIRNIRQKECGRHRRIETIIFFVLLTTATLADPRSSITDMIWVSEGIHFPFFITLVSYLASAFLFALLGFLLGKHLSKKLNFACDVAISLLCIAKIIWLIADLSQITGHLG